MSTAFPPDALLPWLRLTLVPGLTLGMQVKLVKSIGHARAIFEASPMRIMQEIGEEGARSLRTGPDRRLLERTLAWLEAPGNHALTLDDPHYPPLLLEIHDPPPVIYAIGRIELLATQCFAIVGSRNATAQGRRDARSFAETLSASGLTIVSGLALGIDAAAHRGALAAGGSTIAVLGTGMDIKYPDANADLADEIAAEGCVVSDYPLGMPPLPGNFPRRNRLISGMSRGVLVVEAGRKSGSMITAHCAVKENRDVFALPGSIHAPQSWGCHYLIKEGAALVESAEEILTALGMRAASTERREERRPEAHPVLEAIGFAPASIDQIVQRTGLRVPEVAAELSLLEIAGAVALLPGGCFQRIA